MPHRRPPRLTCFDYVGQHRYFVTCCTAGRRSIFRTSDVVSPLTLQILQACSARQFAVLAYVFMPDHVHFLVEGTSADAHYRTLMRVVRQRTSVEYHRRERAALWQEGYFERVLRRDEDLRRLVGYVLANPVRAGLVEKIEDYPFSWSAFADPNPVRATTLR